MGLCLWKCQKSPKNARFSCPKLATPENLNLTGQSYFFNNSAPRAPTEMCQYSLESSDPAESGGGLENFFFKNFDPKIGQKPKNDALY